MKAAEKFDEAVLHGVDFSYREVVRHLFGKAFKQIAIPRHRLLESVHHFTPDKVLRGHYVTQVESESLLKHMTPGLPILLSDSNKFIVQLGVNFRGELPGRWSGHSILPRFLNLRLSQSKVNINLDLSNPLIHNHLCTELPTLQTHIKRAKFLVRGCVSPCAV
jgi:hypothetical protein